MPSSRPGFPTSDPSVSSASSTGSSPRIRSGPGSTRTRSKGASGRAGVLSRRRADIASLAAALDRNGIRPTIEHGDLNGGNILVGEDGVRFFDWGDATLAHPFGTLTTTLSSIAHHMGLDRYGAELARVRDAYTEAWTDVLPRSALAEVAGLAMDLGEIGKSSAWARAVLGVEPSEIGEYGGAAGGWLIDFVERLELRLSP